MKKFILFLSAIFFLSPIMRAQSSETEPNNSSGEANTFALNSTISGQIGVSGDNYDWFKITTTKDGSLTLIGIPENSLDFYLTLWDSDGSSTLAQSSGSNGAGENDTLTYHNLKAGTYYIQMVQYGSTNGTYSLKNVFTETSIPDGNDTEPNDTKENAIQLTLDGSVTGHIGFYGSGSGDNYDWYKITTTKDGSLTLIGIPESSLNFYFNLWDTDGASTLSASSASNGTGVNDTLTYKNLKAGTYYIEIVQYGSSYGSYTFKNVFTETSIPDGNDTEPNDTKENAIQLTLDGSVTGHLGFYGSGSGDNYDWYKITTTKDGSLTLIGIPESSLNFYFNLWDTDGASTLSASSASNGTGVNDTLTYKNLKAGTYYIEIVQYASSYGSYTFKNVFTETSIPDGNDTEPNDTKENAIQLTLDSSVTGHLGFYGSGSGDNYDWYKITTSEDHKLTLIGIPESSLNFYFELINADGSTVLSQTSASNGAGVNDTLVYDNLPAGNYYIKIVQYASSYGSYTFKNIFSGTVTSATTLSGKVTNALDGTAIAGAQVEIAGRTATTDSNGNYEITDIPEAVLTADFSGTPTSGNAPLQVAFTDQSNDAVHTLKVSATGYVNYENNQVAITAGATLTIDVSLSPTLQEGEMRIVLNWGENPHDLDAHLKTPSIDGTEYSIYWFNKGSATSVPFATLDHDDMSSYGPETVTINKLYDGTYKYYVYNYSGSPDITTSNAVVQVYTNDGLIASVNVPTSGTGRYWNVLTIDGSTGAVTVVNEIISTTPVTNPPAFVEKPQVPEEKSAKNTGAITTWNWDFGDGSTSTDQNPTHTYSASGDYTVKLTVGNGSTTDTETKTSYISVNTATVSAIKGKVTNAVDGTAVSGALVQIAGLSATTDSNGDYQITDIPEATLTADFSGTPTSGSSPLAVTFTDGSTDATHKLTVSANNYNTYVNSQVSISTGETLSMDVSLSPVLSAGEFRIVLNWGETPKDLDAHLKTPSIDGTSYSIYYGNKGSATSGAFATLDHDDRTSYGPETVTIYKLFSGTYKYYVYNYSGSPDITTSNAVVQVYSESGLIKTVNIPTSGTGRYWNVITIDGSTGAVTVVNEIVVSTPVVNPPSLTPKVPIPEVKNEESITSWSWDFGDGSTSTEQNPSHTYTATGTYTVALTVSNGSENKTETKTDYITVSGSSSGGTITSTTTGGNWSNTSTWIGGVVPTKDDNVIIQGPVSGSIKCVDLTISENGSISNSVGYVYGDIINRGVFDLSSTTYFYAYGSIVNDGSFNTSTLTLKDNSVVHNFSGDSAFTIHYFTMDSAVQIVAQSDIKLISDIKLYYSSINCGDYDLHLSNSSVNMIYSLVDYNAGENKIIFNNGKLYIEDTTDINQISIHGDVVVNNNKNSLQKHVIISGDVVVNGQLSFQNYYNSDTITGKFTNLGKVEFNSDQNVAYFFDDVDNQGEWIQGAVHLAGDSNQNFTFDSDHVPSGAKITMHIHDTGPYQWYHDGSQTGSGDSTLTALAGYASSWGTYYCDANGVQSRQFIIGKVAALSAVFTADKTSGTAPLTVQFTDQSTGNPSTWSWSFGDGGTSTEQNPSHTYQSAGDYTVQLTVGNGTITNTGSLTDYISVSQASSDPVLSENFDGGTFPPSGWTVSSSNTSNTWGSGNPANHPFTDIDGDNVASAICPYTTENQDEWIKTPVISLPSNVLNIEFYAGYSTSYLTNATLKLKISLDGGSTWTQLWEATDDGSNWSWHEVSIDISSYADNSNVMFGWQYVGADGDLVGIDNVKITQSTTGIHDLPADVGVLNQNYPNPFNYRTNITFKLEHPAQVSLVIYNSLGQKVAVPLSGRMNAGNHKVTFVADGLKSGLYYYQLTLDGLSTTRRMILLK